MSNTVHITFEEDTRGIPADEWRSFCEEHGIQHNFHGSNISFQGDAEIHYSTHRLIFSSNFMWRVTPRVVRLAMLAWVRWGGVILADPEARHFIVSEGTAR